jgi:DNA-binding CsgD family transcriptional regulator
MRYFVGGVIATSAQELVISGVQLSPKQGHPTKGKIKLMNLLVPHIQQATDVMRRLSNLSKVHAAFERTLDWLVDGVLMLANDGSVRYANVAAQAIFRANDGIAIHRSALKLGSGDATAKLGTAMKSVASLRDSEVDGAMQSDFLVERRSGAPAYTISVRPLLAAAGEPNAAVALIFIHDPLARKKTSVELLGQVFHLTTAEAEMANALCLGLSPDEYARKNKISPNTVYTHIRHLKEKTGTRRMTELIRKLNDLRVAVIARRES